MEKKSITSQYREFAEKNTRGKGFTLTELLVVMGIVLALTAITLPMLGEVKRRAKLILGINNQRQTVSTSNLFAIDNHDKYPESVATIGFGGRWHWKEPTMLTGYMKRSPGLHRSMSAYLRSYIPDASIMFCPNAPHKYKYLQEAWDAGDYWDNPDTPPVPDPVFGTYCFYWNYTGFLDGRPKPFRGPWGPSSGGSYSKLLVSDYFGYDHWRRRQAYGSCERFKGADVTEGTAASSAYWSRPGLGDNSDRRTLQITLHAGYTDGHVDSYSPSDVVPMLVSLTPDGTVPNTIGPGVFYLPRAALR